MQHSLISHEHASAAGWRPVCSSRKAVVVRAINVDKEDPQPSASAQSRRTIMLQKSVVIGAALMSMPKPAAAVGFKKELKKRKLSEEDYALSDEFGLKYYELEEGSSGPAIKDGDRVVVHFDVIYRGIDVVSSRSARLLGGNRTIAEPYEYVVGQPVSAQAVKKISDGAGGLFAGTGGPKPPPALSNVALGMKKGGKRSILVPPELGYGEKGIQELPPNTPFELKVEILEVIPRKN